MTNIKIEQLVVISYKQPGAQTLASAVLTTSDSADQCDAMSGGNEFFFVRASPTYCAIA